MDRIVRRLGAFGRNGAGPSDIRGHWPARILNSLWNAASPPRLMAVRAPASAISAWAAVERLGLSLNTASASQTK